MATGINRPRIKPLLYVCLSFATGIALLFLLLLPFWRGLPASHREARLQIRAQASGVNTPDGFFVLHKLDHNGINFKSITLQNNALFIAFDSHAESEAAKQVLSHTLPTDFIIKQCNDDPPLPGLLTDLWQRIK